MKTSEQLRARAADLRHKAEALEQEAKALDERTDPRSWDAIQGAAQRALNGWDTTRMRQAMQSIRGLQATLSKLDWQAHDNRIRTLDKLFNELRLKAEGLEKTRLRKRLYVEHPGASAAEIEDLTEARWEEYRRSL